MMALAAVPALALGGLTAPAAAKPSEPLPEFGFAGQVFDHDQLDYNPTGEFIFPSVFHAGAHLADPLGEWYLYYAPHENPGGISLAYADSLDGPWTEYPANPIIGNDWQPHYGPVSHISSPDAFWHPEQEQVFLYFHGENTTTRYATSNDGVRFDYGGVAVTAADSGAGVSEASYARVFSLPKPRRGARYGMFYMDNLNNTRRIRLATSADARTWRVDPEPLVSPGAAEGANVSSADLWQWRGQYYVVYHASSGNVHARTVNPKLTKVGPSQVLHSPMPSAPDSGRSAAPQIVEEDGRLYLFYEAGSRLSATIAYATQVVPGEDPLYERCPGAGSDEFGGAELDRSIWTRLVREEQSRHQLAGGALVLPTYPSGVNGTPLVQQPVPDGAWEATVAVSVDPTATFQQAGLLLYADDANYAKADLVYGGRGLTVEFIHRRNGSDRNTAEDSFPAPVGLGGVAWFRLTNDGEQVTASLSVDGRRFAGLGRPVALADLAATHLGPYAMQGATGATETTARFDWFRFTPTAAEQEACQG
jgi:regulation of enolase protein 1 (concanavalin A-like superfamily)